MNWTLVEKILDDYFNPEDFAFEIKHGEDESETECTGVLKIDKGPREQKVSIYFESEDNINFLRIVSPLVAVDRLDQEQLIRLLEQNMSWIRTSVGIQSRQIVYTCVVPVQEFEHDHAILGDAIVKLARRADQMESLLFGRDRK